MLKPVWSETGEWMWREVSSDGLLDDLDQGAEFFGGALSVTRLPPSKDPRLLTPSGSGGRTGTVRAQSKCLSEGPYGKRGTTWTTIRAGRAPDWVPYSTACPSHGSSSAPWTRPRR